MPAQPPPVSPLLRFSGIGPAIAQRLERLGVRRPEDFLWLLPLRYEDETQLVPLAALRPGITALVEGTVVYVDVPPKGATRPLRVMLRDGASTLTGVWFRFFPGTLAAHKEGAQVRWFGEVRAGLEGALEMVHPRVRPAGAALPAALTPIYPATEGLSQPQLRRWVARALALFPLKEWLPEHMRQALALPPLPQALPLIHAPPPGIDLEHPEWQAARARLAFDELVAHQVALWQRRQAQPSDSAIVFAGEDAAAGQAHVRARLPFSLTGAQERVVSEIAADLARAQPMARLVLGDVGSGKTAVAALALARVVAAGWQGALMAPTEILANQLSARLREWFAGLAPVALLTASTPARALRQWQELLAAGEPAVVVGTHALIEEKVALPRLALAIVDEQHRFGVRQRALLRQKTAGAMPHLLMMSATPIPRTLAQTLYADLDVSFLDERPPGRLPVTTTLLAQSRLEALLTRLRAWCSSGQQAYWVCPLVESSEAMDLTAATERYEALQRALPGVRVALLHGRMKAEEKAAVMSAFAAGEVQLLVATSVIEVGVDVPNANLIVIEHAERFGLAQLHQLRGRVGRGGAQAYCVLLYGEPLGAMARARLEALRSEQDGFRLAQLDLQLRGPGEFTGVRQSGLPAFRLADLARDEHLIAPAQAQARRLVQQDPATADALVQRWLPLAGVAVRA